MGYPLEKRYEKGIQREPGVGPEMEPFWSQSEHRDLSQKMFIFRFLPKRPESGIGAPFGRLWSPKEWPKVLFGPAECVSNIVNNYVS